jgi:phage virion morphogenesis protein
MTASLDDREFQQALSRLAGLMTNPTPLLRAIGAGLVATTDARFSSGTDPWGRSWTPLNPAYAAAKRNSQILVESTALVRSVNFQTEGREVAVGSPLIYAGVHQTGATIKPVRAKALAFKLGGQFVRARSVFIPARPYLGMGPADIAAVELAAEVVLRKALAAR